MTYAVALAHPVNDILLNRRKLLQRSAALSFATPASLFFDNASAQTTYLEPSAECVAPAAATRPQTAGPFFTPDTPLKRNFRDDAPGGEPLSLIGFVKTPDCRPVANAVVELWHANTRGRYDNQGYIMRGHQITDAMGRFLFETIVPGRYPGRTRHYHVTVAPPAASPLTTQLYFPNESGNRRDWLFNEKLLLEIGHTRGVDFGRFDFVVEAG